MDSRTPSGECSRHHQNQQQRQQQKPQENHQGCGLDFKSDSPDVLKGLDVTGTLVERNSPVTKQAENPVSDPSFLTQCTAIAPCKVPFTSSGYHSGSSSAETDQDDGDNDDDDDVEKEPRNFSWVLDGLLCACAFPHRPAHFRYLANKGVTRIVSLTAERDLDEKLAKDFEVIRLGVQDFTPPTLDQIDRFVEVVEKAEAERSRVAVHCAAGKGRTGTAIACFLVHRFRLSDQQAIRDLRALRPGSVETSEQEVTVKRFHDRLLLHDDSPTERAELLLLTEGAPVKVDELYWRYREKLCHQVTGAQPDTV